MIDAAPVKRTGAVVDGTDIVASVDESRIERADGSVTIDEALINLGTIPTVIDAASFDFGKGIVTINVASMERTASVVDRTHVVTSIDESRIEQLTSSATID